MSNWKVLSNLRHNAVGYVAGDILTEISDEEAKVLQAAGVIIDAEKAQVEEQVKQDVQTVETQVKEDVQTAEQAVSQPPATDQPKASVASKIKTAITGGNAPTEQPTPEQVADTAAKVQ